nr:hypothetical protein GCM10020092_008390 [Actinoplanes digitatis]
MASLDKAEDPAWSRPRPHAAQAEQPDDGPTVRPFRPAKATGSPVNGGATGGVRPLPPVPSLAELMGGLNVSGDPAAAAAAGRPGPNPVSRTAAAAYGLAPVPAATTAADLAETLAGLGLGGPGTTPQPPAMLRPMHPDPVQRNLMMVGMPEEMVAQIVGGDTYSGVLGVLASRPAAPGVPDAPGEILVLCGDLDHALPLGRKLCEQAGIDQAHLLLGGPTAAGTGLHSSKVLGDPPTAATRAERLQNADHAWIVVVDAKVGGTDPIWVSDMCEALGATAVWAVVDATRKTTDTARHLRMLGDVEALVVHSLDLTSDPATVLGLERPVVSLDGKPATPHAWAAMLCARIASDVVPMPALPRRPPGAGNRDPALRSALRAAHERTGAVPLRHRRDRHQPGADPLPHRRADRRGPARRAALRHGRIRQDGGAGHTDVAHPGGAGARPLVLIYPVQRHTLTVR